MQATASSSDYTYIIDIEIVPLRPDWPLLIEDIRERGYSYNRIATSLGVEWSTFQNWRAGSEPRFYFGHALIILHSKVCGSALTEDRFIKFSGKS